MKARIHDAIRRLESIGLEPLAHSIVNMNCYGFTFSEHLDWLLTAEPKEIRAWWDAIGFDSNA